MATTKVVLRKKANKDGTFPIAIRITKDRKTSFIHLGYNVREEEWDILHQRVKKSYPNSTKLNNLIVQRLAEASGQSLSLETEKKTVSAQNIKRSIKSQADGSVFIQADLYLERLEQARKYNRHSADKPRVKHLKAFLKKDIQFSELTIPLIKRYKNWLMAEYKMSERSAVNHLVVLRSIFSQAIEEKACEEKYYPFGKGKIIIKFPESIKIGGDEADIRAIEAVDLSDAADLHHARNLWLFSFYFAGMRVSDVLRTVWSAFQNGRHYYVMGKNNKVDSLKIPVRAQNILDEYQDQKDETDLVFPELKTCKDLSDAFIVQAHIKVKLKLLNDALAKVAERAKIDKKITMHISRHSFGNISGDTISIQMLQKLYRHTHISTTVGYQSTFINKAADDALDTVLNAV